MSSISKQSSTLADDGAVSETTISITQRYNEYVSTTIENVTVPVVTPYRAATNLQPAVTPDIDANILASENHGCVSSPPATYIALYPLLCTPIK